MTINSDKTVIKLTGHRNLKNVPMYLKKQTKTNTWLLSTNAHNRSITKEKGQPNASCWMCTSKSASYYFCWSTKVTSTCL